MTDILSIETLYGIGSVLLTMAVLAPVVFASPAARFGAKSSFLGERIRQAAPWRPAQAETMQPTPTTAKETSFKVDIPFAATRFDRSAIDAKSVQGGVHA